MIIPTLLVVKNLAFIIHTRDHGFPHVTVYQGLPDRYEAKAKIRLDNLTVLKVEKFSQRDVAVILKVTAQYKNDWLEVWNEIFEDR